MGNRRGNIDCKRQSLSADTALSTILVYTRAERGTVEFSNGRFRYIPKAQGNGSGCWGRKRLRLSVVDMELLRPLLKNGMGTEAT